jgi:hypothetical protein
MHQLLALVSNYCEIESLARLAACSRQFRKQVQGELVQQQLVRLLPDALCCQKVIIDCRRAGEPRVRKPEQPPVRMQWLCTTVGSEFIKAHAAAIGAASLQAQDVDALAANKLCAAGLEIPHAAVLAAAPRAALLPCRRIGPAAMLHCGFN